MCIYVHMHVEILSISLQIVMILFMYLLTLTMQPPTNNLEEMPATGRSATRPELHAQVQAF